MILIFYSSFSICLSFEFRKFKFSFSYETLFSKVNRYNWFSIVSEKLINNHTPYCNFQCLDYLILESLENSLRINKYFSRIIFLLQKKKVKDDPICLYTKNYYIYLKLKNLDILNSKVFKKELCFRF